MASSMIRICPRRKFDGSSLSNNSIVITVAEHIYLAPGTDVELVARLHRNNLGTGSTLTVALVGDFYDSQDPGSIFINSSLILTNSIQFGTNDTAPKGLGSAVGQSSLAVRFGAVQVTLVKTTNPCDADISIDLNIRSYERYVLAPDSYCGYRHW